MGLLNDNFQKWFEDREGAILTAASSLMCLLGCCIVYVDVIYQKLFPQISKRHKFEINSNGKFMISCLSISSGSLIFTALTKMFPKASIYFSQHKKLKKMPKMLNFILLASFLLGISIFTVLNIIIHRFTSESILHCAHSGTHKHSHNSHDEEHDAEDHSHSHLHGISEENEENHEDEPLLADSDSQNDYSSTGNNNNNGNSEDTSDCPNLHIKYSQLKSLEALKVLKHPWSKESNAKLVAFSDLEAGNNSKSHRKSKRSSSHNHNHARSNSSTSNSIIGVSLTKSDSIDDIMLVSELSETEHTDHSNDHTHRHVETSVSELFSIGIQTTLGISLHKLPEGFIYYLTSKIDQQLSFNIFLSLAIHNIAEGFSMTIPLYLSLNSRIQAVLICGVLGGFSQPFGALLAALIFGRSSSLLQSDNINLVFGVLMSITSGFLTIVGLQMLLNCVSFGGSHNFITFWFLVGLSIICFTNILTGNLLL